MLPRTDCLLGEARGTLITKAQYPQERDISKEEPRIGVFVCNCGINIAGTVDVEEVARWAGTLDGVVVSREYKFLCSSLGQAMIGIVNYDDSFGEAVAHQQLVIDRAPTSKAAADVRGLAASVQGLLLDGMEPEQR